MKEKGGEGEGERGAEVREWRGGGQYRKGKKYKATDMLNAKYKTKQLTNYSTNYVINQLTQ